MNKWTVVVEGDVRKAARKDGYVVWKAGHDTAISIEETRSRAIEIARGYGPVLYTVLGSMK